LDRDPDYAELNADKQDMMAIPREVEDRPGLVRDRCRWRTAAPQGALVKAEFGMIHRASSSSPGSARLLPTASWRAHPRPPACAAPFADPTD